MRLGLLGVLLMGIASPGAAQDVKIEDVVKLIESKNEGLQSFTCDATLNGYSGFMGLPSVMLMKVGYKKGELFTIDAFSSDRTQQTFGTWAYLSEGFAYKVAFSASNFQEAFLVAAKSPRTTRMDAFAMYVGMGLHLLIVDSNVLPKTVFPAKPKMGKEKIGDVEYITVRVSNAMAALVGRQLSIVYFVNPTTGRVDQVKLVQSGSETIAVVEKWHDLGGVQLPAVIALKQPNFDQRAIGSIRYFNYDTKAPARPYWVDDPNLPEVTSESVKSLERKIEKDKQNATLYLQSANVLQIGSFIAFGGENLMPEFKKLATKAYELKPDSIIAQEMSAFAALATRDDELVKKIFDSGKATPGSLVLKAMQELVDSPKSVAKTVEPLPEDGILGVVRQRVTLKAKLASADGDEFVKIVEEALSLTDTERALALANDLEAPIVNHWGGMQMEAGIFADRDKALGEKLIESKNDFVKLVGVRGLVRLQENKLAGKGYNELSKNDALFARLRREFELFVRRAPAEAGDLVLKIVQSGTNDAPLLAAFAVRQFESEKDKAKETCTKIIKALQSVGENHWIPQNDMNALKALLEKLIELKEAQLATDVLSALAKCMSFPDDSMRDIIKKATAGDKEKMYDIVKRMRYADIYYFQRFGVSENDAFDVIQRRAEKDALEESDYRVVTKFVRRQKRSAEALELLKKGVEKFPEATDLLESLGDCYFLNKLFKEAIQAYEAAHKRELAGKTSPHSVISYSSHQIEEFHPTDGLVVKLAWAYMRSGDKEGAKKAVRNFEKESKDPRHLSNIAIAYEIADDLDRAGSAYKKLLFKHSRQYYYDHISLAIRFVKILVKQQKTPEAFFAAEKVLDMLKGKLSSWDDDNVNELRKMRDELNKQLGEDYFINYILEQKPEKLPEDKAARAKDLIDRLSSEDAKERQAARDRLREMGKTIAPLLKESIESGDPELKSSLRSILQDWAIEELKKKFDFQDED